MDNDPQIPISDSAIDGCLDQGGSISSSLFQMRPLMKALVAILLLSAKGFATSPGIPQQAIIDVHQLIMMGCDGRHLKEDVSKAIPRLKGVDATLPKIFADLAPEFRWNKAANRPGFTITVITRDRFRLREDVSYTVMIVTDKHVIHVRLRYEKSLFYVLGYAVELAPAPVKDTLRFVGYGSHLREEQAKGMNFHVVWHDFREPQQFLELGDIVKGTKFKLTKFQYKSRRVPHGYDEDVSELTLTDTETNETIVLVLEVASG